MLRHIMEMQCLIPCNENFDAACLIEVPFESVAMIHEHPLYNSQQNEEIKHEYDNMIILPICITLTKIVGNAHFC